MSEIDDFMGFNPRDLDVFNEKPSTSGNPLIYKTRPAESKAKDGIYRSTIRVLYNPFDLQHSILEQQSYAMEDGDGYFSVVSSLTNNDKECPIFKAWKKCHFADKDKQKALYMQAETKDKGGKGLFDKRFARYVLIQVMKDENHPELVGNLMFFKLPKSIWEDIEGKMNPSVEDTSKTPIPVMDFIFGRAINLEVKPGPDDPQHPERKTRETSYKCEIKKVMPMTNPDGSSLLSESEQAIADKYVKAMEDGVWDEEDPDKRTSNLATINADPNTAEFRKVYRSVLDKIKGFAPNLIEELGYKDWTKTDIAPRVYKWIDNVLNLKDPKTADLAPDAAKVVGTESLATPQPAPGVEIPVPIPTEDTGDDLPF